MNLLTMKTSENKNQILWLIRESKKKIEIFNESEERNPKGKNIHFTPVKSVLRTGEFSKLLSAAIG